MWQGTTPSVVIKTDIDLTEMATVELTIEDRQKTKLILTTDELTITEDTVTVDLAQEDTLNLAPGRVRLQLRAKTISGDVIASNIMMGDLQFPVYEGEV